MNKNRISPSFSAGLLHLRPFELPLLGLIPAPFALIPEKNSENWSAQQIASYLASRRRLRELAAGHNVYLRRRGLIT